MLPIAKARKLEQEFYNDILIKEAQEHLITLDEANKINKEIKSFRDKEDISSYVARLESAVKTRREAAEKRKAMLEGLEKKTEAANKYAYENCRTDDYKKEGLLTPEHKAELLKLLDGVTQEELALVVRKRNDMMFFVAVQLITDQKVLEDLLVTNTGWISGGYRDGMYASDFRKAYYQLYKNVTDQDLLLKLLKQKEVSFSTDSCSSVGYRDKAVFRQLDKEHLDILNRQRVARRRAAHGRTIDVNGFYIGMPRQDFELLQFTRGLTIDDVNGSFGTWKIGAASRIWISQKYSAQYLDLSDGLSGLSEFTDRFVPGGEDNAGEAHRNADAKDTYDIACETKDVRIDPFWWRSCPKFGCQIKMYDGGNIVIESDENDLKFDLSAADSMLNEDFDESKLDSTGSSSTGGGFFKLILILGIVGAILYIFRSKIDGFVVTHPKYAKAWSIACVIGEKLKEVSIKCYSFALSKIKEHKEKKATK